MFMPDCWIAPSQFAHVARGEIGYCDLPTRLERPQSASGGEREGRGGEAAEEETGQEKKAALGGEGGGERIVNGIQQLLDVAQLCPRLPAET